MKIDRNLRRFNALHLLLAVAVVTFTHAPQARTSETYDLSPRLYQKYRSTTGSVRTYQRFIHDDGSLLDAGEGRKIARFLAHPDVEDYALKAQKYLADFIRDPRILNALLYLNWNWSTPEQRINAGRLVGIYYAELMMALQESADDPRLRPAWRKQILGWLKDIDAKAGHPPSTAPGSGVFALAQQAGRCLENIPSSVSTSSPIADWKKAAMDRISPIRHCLLTAFPEFKVTGQPFATLDIRRLLADHPGSVIAKSGFIPGNKVTALNLNRESSDREYEAALEAFTTHIIKPYGKKWAALTDPDMITQMKALIQTAEAEGRNPVEAVFIDAVGGRPDEVVYESGSVRYTKSDTLNIDRNPVWQFYGDPSTHRNQTFPNIVKTIRSAESSVFINLFFYGGTMGLSMTDLLLKEMARKPQLRVIMVRDHVNHFGHQDEMRPVFNFLRAWMTLHPHRLLAVPANIFDKRVNGFPEFVKGLVNDEILSKLGLDNNMSLYLKAQSDHTKLVVTDGDRPQGHPRMIVGSKNWTDASGAICNDESLLIEGPAAVVALDNYYDDLYEALKLSWDVRDPYWNALYEDVYSRGWAQSPECQTNAASGSQFLRKVVQILCPVDVLKRHKLFGESLANFPPQEKFAAVKARRIGNDLVRFGENNAAASIISTANQNILAILSAKKQILINEQLLYAPGIIEALKFKAKKGVAVRVILEGFIHEGAQFPGMPNLLYLSDMQAAGIQVKWKTHAPSKTFVPEHHGKTISIDGWLPNGGRVDSRSTPNLIVGSANKDLLTMKGAFRETQVEVFSVEASKAHDRLFWQNWNSPHETRVASFREFSASPLGQQMEKSGMTTTQFMKYVTEFLNAAYSTRPIAR